MGKQRPDSLQDDRQDNVRIVGPQYRKNKNGKKGIKISKTGY